jgi:hypothetical protein
MASFRFPELFGVVKTQANPRCIHILRAVRARIGPDEFYEVMTFNNADVFLTLPLIEDNRSELDRTIRVVNRQNIADQIIGERCWLLPFHYNYNGHHVPIYDFQYRSWLPNGNHNIPFPSLEYETRMVHIVNNTCSQRLEQINGHVVHVQTPLSTVVSRGPSPPPMALNPSSGADASPNPMVTPPRFPRLNLNDLLNAARHVENHYEDDDEEDGVYDDMPPLISNQPPQVPLHLPQFVGEMLIARARQSTDVCPIMLGPYADAQRLAVTSCFHVFDAMGMDNLLERGDNCPVCRANIVNTVYEAERLTT